jgi:hypothetical protein
MMIDPNVLEAYAAVGGVLVAIFGLIFVILQLRNLEQSVRAASHSAVYVQASDFRGHLVSHPELRKYFFEGVAIEPGHPDYDRALTIAELYLNQLEQITVTKESLGADNRDSLDDFINVALAKSPIMRRRLKESPQYFSHTLRDYLAKDEA